MKQELFHWCLILCQVFLRNTNALSLSLSQQKINSLRIKKHINSNELIIRKCECFKNSTTCNEHQAKELI